MPVKLCSVGLFFLRQPSCNSRFRRRRCGLVDRWRRRYNTIRQSKRRISRGGLVLRRSRGKHHCRGGLVLRRWQRRKSSRGKQKWRGGLV